MNVKLRNMTAIYIMKDDMILMLYRVGSKVVRDSWCGIVGHFENDELNDPQKAMLRELKEEANIDISSLENLKMRYVTLRLKNGEVRQNYYFFANLKENTSIDLNTNEGTLKWIPISEVLNLEMPFTAKEVLKHYIETAMNDDILHAGTTMEHDVLFHPLKEFD